MKRVLLLLLILFISIFSICCQIIKAQNRVKENHSFPECSLNNEEFDIDFESFSSFKHDLESFMNGEYEYDVLTLFIKGGNNQESKLQRCHSNINGEWINIKKSPDSIIENKFYSEELIILIDEIKQENYIQSCDYTTNNDAYLIMIRNKKGIVFKYYSISRNYTSLAEDDILRLDGMIKVIDLLKEK